MFSQITSSFAHRAARAFGRKHLALGLERPMISITFDDFPVSAWEIGGRILEQHGGRGSYYVSGKLCGTLFEGKPMIDVHRLAEVAAAGHEIGCHTFSHRRLLGAPDREIETEIDANLSFLRTVLPQQEIATFAYPYGAVSVAAKRIASRRFGACRGVFAGINAENADFGLLAGVCLEAHVLLRRSVAQWIQDAVRVNGWLIFLTHDVTDAPSAYGVTPRFLEDVVKSAVAAGCDVLPVRDALKLAASRMTA
jgi:peptidoglycan/xylan/chitin deacetylase (PgdA/CDA1 family)